MGVEILEKKKESEEAEEGHTLPSSRIVDGCVSKKERIERKDNSQHSQETKKQQNFSMYLGV